MKSLVFLTVLINFISSTIIINGPPELIKYYSDKTGKSNITATYSHFGRIPYGFQIVILNKTRVENYTMTSLIRRWTWLVNHF